MVGDAVASAVFHGSRALDADRGPRRGGAAARLRKLGRGGGKDRDRRVGRLLLLATLSLSASLRLERTNLLVQPQRRVAGGKDHALLRGARGDSARLCVSVGAPGRDVGLVVACGALSSLGRPKRAAHPQRPHEGAESRLVCLGIGGGTGTLLSARLRVSRPLRVSRVGVRVAPCGDVLGVEDGGSKFSQVFVRVSDGLDACFWMGGVVVIPSYTLQWKGFKCCS